MRSCKQRRTVFPLHVQNLARIARRIGPAVSPVPDNSDRDIRITVPCSHDIDEFRSREAFLVDGYCEKIHLARIHILVQHVKSQGIVDVIAHVRIENNVYYTVRFASAA